MSILVVDDNSPDGTAKIVDQYTEKFSSSVFLLNRRKKIGLGSAYIAGFKYAMDELGVDAVFEMDADFSHDPKDVPRFMEEVSNGSDFVIGSRYIRGGNIPDWGFKRRMISRGGNFFARAIAGIPVNDCTSGFRAIKTSLLEKIDLDSLGAQGYAFQMNLLNEAMKNGAKIKEIPITFNNRKYGESKLGNGDIQEFFFNAFKIRLEGGLFRR